MDREAIAVACTFTVLGAMRLCTGQQRIALATLPPSWWALCARDDGFAAGM